MRLKNTPSGLTESMSGEIISRINQSINKLINQPAGRYDPYQSTETLSIKLFHADYLRLR